MRNFARIGAVVAVMLAALVPAPGPALAITAPGATEPSSTAGVATSETVPPLAGLDPTVTPFPPRVIPTITVTAVGDMCFDSAPKRLIQSSGYTAPFSAVKSALVGSNVTLGNLECPLSWRGTAVGGKAFTFRGDPRAAKGLAWAGFDLVAQGNNHAMDYGATALKDTIAYLDSAKVAHAGAGANSSIAFRATTIKRNGARIAFLSFSQIGPSSFAAGSHRYGTAYTQSLSKVKSCVVAARKHADYVIVSFHWGVERQYTPTSSQVSFGHAAVNSGADLVLSEHPHVIQGVEFYRHKLIAYSLGNFIFSPGSASGHDSMILTIQLTRARILSVKARPCHIDGNGRPVFATGSTRTRILGIISSTSRGRGTHVTLSNGIAYLRAR